MRSIRNIALSALLTVGAFTTITYTACTKDECKDVVCQNGGTCVAGSCNCPTGYEGANCETLSRLKFIGTWTGSDVCDTNVYDITMSIKESSNEVQALVSNPGGFGDKYTITGVVSNTSELSFTKQSVGGNGRILNGKMTVNGNSLTFDYTVTDAGGGSAACNGTYSKQ